MSRCRSRAGCAKGRTDLLAVDFSHAFVAVGVISLASLIWYRQLAPDAGAEMSGHQAEAGNMEQA